MNINIKNIDSEYSLLEAKEMILTKLEEITTLDIVRILKEIEMELENRSNYYLVNLKNFLKV